MPRSRRRRQETPTRLAQKHTPLDEGQVAEVRAIEVMEAEGEEHKAGTIWFLKC